MNICDKYRLKEVFALYSFDAVLHFAGLKKVLLLAMRRVRKKQSNSLTDGRNADMRICAAAPFSIG